MISCSEVGIGNRIALMLLLEHILHFIKDQELETQKQEKEEEFILSQGLRDPIKTDSIAVRNDHTEEEE